MNVIPWTEKYRPETSRQVCGNVLEFEQVLKYGSESKNLLLHGPSGTGKSTAVRVLLKNIPKDSKLILDAKARASGTTQQLIRKLTLFSMQKTTSKQRFVLVDEVDSIRIIDQKIFIRPLTKDISRTEGDSERNIIFLFICNRIERVSEFIFRNYVPIAYNSLTFSMAKGYIKMICDNENTVYDESSLKDIFHKVGRDMRKMVSTMQYLYLMTGRISHIDFLKIDPCNNLNYVKLFDRILKSDNIVHVTNELYGESYSVNALCIFSLKYHEEKELLTHEYVKTLAHLCHDSHTTENIWFILYRLISESPIKLKSYCQDGVNSS